MTFRYDVTIVLDLPESKLNHDLGVFMVDLIMTPEASTNVKKDLYNVPQPKKRANRKNKVTSAESEGVNSKIMEAVQCSDDGMFLSDYIEIRTFI